MGALQFFPNASSADAGANPPSFIVWRPGPLSEGVFFNSWEEIQEKILLSNGSLTVYVDDSDSTAVVPNTFDTDCRGRTVFTSYGPRQATIYVNDGGVIRNPGRIDRITITGPFSDPVTVTPFLHFDGQSIPVMMGARPTISFIMESAAEVIAKDGSTVSAMLVEETVGTLKLFQRSNAKFTNNNVSEPLVSVIGVDDGLGNVVVQHFIQNTEFPYPPELFSGGGDVDVEVYFDPSVFPVAQPNLTNPISRVPQMYRPRSGPTASRPSIAADEISVGELYFDTDLGYPVYSNGTIYVDGTGAPA